MSWKVSLETQDLVCSHNVLKCTLPQGFPWASGKYTTLR